MPHSTNLSDTDAALKHEPSRAVRAPIGFLKKSSVFDHEEPYAFRYQAEGLEVQTNMETEYMEVDICDIRGQEDRTSLDTCGFQVGRLRTNMTYEQFGSDEDIRNVYLRDLKDQLLDDFGAARIEFGRVRVRRRHPDFPKSTGTAYDHHQPSTAAHVDFTDGSAETTLEEKTGGYRSSGRPFRVLNIWKPLRGPLEDWPLAVCDARSVDVANDLIEATILHPDRKNRNCQVHFNDRHRWFYLGRQCDDELMIFRQYDSRLGDNNGVPHSSFPDPNTPRHASLRESIEVVACLYF